MIPSYTEVLESRSRFQVYFIDSGFNPIASPVMQLAIRQFQLFAKDADLFLLDEKTSTSFLRKFPLLIGKDPVIVVVDNVARKQGFESGFGVHFQFGSMRTEDRMRYYVKLLLRAMNDPYARQDLAATMREAVHLDGVRGTYQILMETLSTELHHH